MIALLLLLSAPSQAACPVSPFAFVGQPECVALTYADGRTHLRNDCEATLLVDQAVALPGADGHPQQLVGAHEEVVIRDLNRFTLAMDGGLYGVVATLAEVPAECVAEGSGETAGRDLAAAEEAEAPAESSDAAGAWFQGVLGAIVSW